MSISASEGDMEATFDIYKKILENKISPDTSTFNYLLMVSKGIVLRLEKRRDPSYWGIFSLEWKLEQPLRHIECEVLRCLFERSPLHAFKQELTLF